MAHTIGTLLLLATGAVVIGLVGAFYVFRATWKNDLNRRD